jgi:S-DNA-T family DNA segregation ATPase FtsK/SpoIIIE
MEEIEKLNNIFNAFSIKAKCIDYSAIRNMSLYDIALEPGTKVKTISAFSNELALALKAKSSPMIKILSEQGIVRLEVLTDKPQKVSFYNTREVPKGHKIPLYLGSSIDGEEMWIDLANNPHTLIAGCTGSGKSTLLHTIIANCLNIESSIFVIDTKNIEFQDYAKCGVSITNSYEQALNTIKILHSEMDRRYNALTNDISYLNSYKPIILIIDEFADLSMQDDSKELFNVLCRLLQKCRAANIYCVLATQRPSTDIVNGAIKANFPARISCKVASSIDSRVILGIGGAESLAGNGDSIVNNYKYSYQRFQAAYTSSKEVCAYNGVKV